MRRTSIVIGMDDPPNIDMLHLLEPTGAWVSEARFLPNKVIDAVTGLNRYLSKKEGSVT